jgi:hypothetical protein
MTTPSAYQGSWMTAYLGDTETTPEQRADLLSVAAEVQRRWPGEDDEDERREVLSGAAQVILGRRVAEQFAAEWRHAHALAEEARLRMAGAVLVTARSTSEHEIARRTGLARDTIRKALGKG